MHAKIEDFPFLTFEDIRGKNQKLLTDGWEDGQRENSITIHLKLCFTEGIDFWQKKKQISQYLTKYSKTCVKGPLSKRPNIGFQDQLSLNEGQK